MTSMGDVPYLQRAGPSRESTWPDFQRQRMHDHLRFISLPFAAMATGFAFDCVGRFMLHTPDRWSVLATTMVFATLYFCGIQATQHVRACSSKQKKYWHSIMVQLATVHISLCVCAYRSLLITSEGRRFGSYNSGFLFTLFWSASINYMPGKWYLCGVAVPAMAYWVQFHHVTGSLSPMTCVWAMLWPAISCWVSYNVEQSAWNWFQAMEKETQSRMYSEALERALRSMLNGIFDASCECLCDGKIVHASPQMQFLVGNSNHPLNGVKFSELGASKTESVRIEKFLEQCMAQSPSYDTPSPALCLESSIRSSGSSSPDTFLDIPVQISCVALPLSTLTSSMHRLLIGIQHARARFSEAVAQWEDILASDIEGGGHLFREDTLRPEGNSVQTSAQPSQFDFDIMSLGSLTHSESKGTTQTTTQTARTGRSVHAVAMVSKSVQTEPYSLNVQDASCQADTICDIIRHQQHANGLAPTSHSVQNSAPQTQVTPIQCPHCFLPRPSAGLTRERKWLASRRSRRRVQKVILNGSKRILQDFKETPDGTVQASIMDLMKAINACGQGCCAFHIVLAKISMTVQKLDSFRCDLDFTPFADWQCDVCKAMNATDDEDDDESTLAFCLVCNQEKQECHINASEDADQEDFEHVEGSAGSSAS